MADVVGAEDAGAEDAGAAAAGTVLAEADAGVDEAAGAAVDRADVSPALGGKVRSTAVEPQAVATSIAHPNR